MNFTNGRRKGMGKIEFLANKPKILQMLAQGYSPLLVFEALCENKQVSISYRQFCRYVASLRRKPLSPAQRNTGSHSSTRVSTPDFTPSPLDAPELADCSSNGQTPTVTTRKERKRQHKKDKAEATGTLLLALPEDMVNFNPKHFTDLNSTPDSELDSEK